jgi:hypothetical protein
MHMLQRNPMVLPVCAELSVLCVPRLEAAYRAHRHCGFRCTPLAGQAPPLAPPQQQQRQHSSPPPPRIEFRTLEHCSSLQRAGQEEEHDVVVMPVPLPYALPPRRYQQGADKPWMADVAQGSQDMFGKSFDPRQRKAFYGLTEAPWPSV